MTGIGMDGSRGWAAGMWDMLADGGVWGIPRCGLVFRKDAGVNTMTLIERMPWDPEMPCTPEQLLAAQDEDYEGIATMFASIGVIVMPLEI